MSVVRVHPSGTNARVVERQTHRSQTPALRHGSSNLPARTNHLARVAEQEDAPASNSGASACRFDPCRGHQDYSTGRLTGASPSSYMVTLRCEQVAPWSGRIIEIPVERRGDRSAAARSTDHCLIPVRDHCDRAADQPVTDVKVRQGRSCRRAFQGLKATEVGYRLVCGCPCDSIARHSNAVRVRGPTAHTSDCFSIRRRLGRRKMVPE